MSESLSLSALIYVGLLNNLYLLLLHPFPDIRTPMSNRETKLKY